MKRLLDIVFSLAIIVACLPLFMTIALVIIVKCGRPVIFTSVRIGREGRAFEMYKFRTLVTEAPLVSTVELRRLRDYHTSVGRVLRSYSLDEIPQFFNVLVGDMSLVGPRPAIASQAELLRERENRGITSLRPGITGWAQINGRDNISDAEKISLDQYYFENANVVLDLRIMMKTIFHIKDS